jgi:hypothetical protein
MDRQVGCICTVQEEIKGFHSLSEFERFTKYVEGLVNNKDLTEIPVSKRYADSQIFKEHWYECNLCKQIWRLVAPDFPFSGLWEKVQ